MNNEMRALHQALSQAYIRIGALESMMLLFLGAQAKRDPSVAVMLREMAAGEVPDMLPDMSVRPPDLTERERAEIAESYEQQKKVTRQYMMRLANMYAEHIKRQK